ncbi:MAG: hypothetical protein V7784_07515 [Oceanospirillaceae bacterium]
MSEIGHMTFFNVDLCGLYRVGLKKNHGYKLSESFDLILNWAQNRALASTIPWDPDHSRTNKTKCYCKDIYKDDSTGDFLVVLWKSDSDSSGSLYGAEEDNQTGTGDVIKYTNNYRGKKVIWGRACYYWIVPSENVVVSVKFEHSSCDAELFTDYVKACINNRVQHINRKKESTEHGFVRISHNLEDKCNLSYRLAISLKSLNTSGSELTKLAKNVTHLVRRETILVDTTDERGEWLKLFDSVPYMNVKPRSNKRKIEVKAEAKPTAEEIKKIIEKFSLENRKTTDWDNIGFSTEKGITWVDKYRLRDQITVSDPVSSTYKAEELYKEIFSRRENLLWSLRKANKADQESIDNDDDDDDDILTLEVASC